MSGTSRINPPSAVRNRVQIPNTAGNTIEPFVSGDEGFFALINNVGKMRSFKRNTDPIGTGHHR